jgi:hypothetical protein
MRARNDLIVCVGLGVGRGGSPKEALGPDDATVGDGGTPSQKDKDGGGLTFDLIFKPGATTATASATVAIGPSPTHGICKTASGTAHRHGSRRVSVSRND